MGQKRIQKKPAPVEVAVDWRVIAGIIIALAFGTLVVYLRVVGHQFLQFDDPEYIKKNFNIVNGPTPEAIRWAFAKTGYCSNWHPLTWISHMIDMKIFGMDAGMHLLVNVALHIGSTVLLFLGLFKLTGSPWRSAFVAALFAVHPAHVESVAWVAERKDVLSTFFLMLTILSYAHYVKRKGTAKYALYGAMIVSYALGLLSKPMLVTLPFVLLLLDWWPLGRFARVQNGKKVETRPSIFSIVAEKLPLFAMAAFSSYMTYSVQRMGGAVASTTLTLGMRIDNAFVAYANYIGKLLFPVKLAVVYPHPGNTLPIVNAIAAMALIAALSIAFARMTRKHPYIGMGWVFFIFTLLPVIGLFVQVGEQGMADRYTYVPYIGLFIMIAWGVPELLARMPDRKRAQTLGALAGVVILALAAGTYHQVGYWKDTGTLFRHTIAVTPPNITAEINLGAWLEDPERGKRPEAIEHYKAALDVNPNHVRSLNLLATAYARDQRYQEAVDIYQKALSLSDDLNVTNNIGLTLNEMGKPKDAIPYLEKVIALKPDFFAAYNNLGNSYRMLGQYDKAVELFDQAIGINPSLGHSYANRGLVRVLQGRFDEALADYAEALRVDPNLGYVHTRMGAAYYFMKRYPEALEELRQGADMGVEPDPALLADLKARLGQ